MSDPTTLILTTESLVTYTKDGWKIDLGHNGTHTGLGKLIVRNATVIIPDYQEDVDLMAVMDAVESAVNDADAILTAMCSEYDAFREAGVVRHYFF